MDEEAHLTKFCELSSAEELCTEISSSLLNTEILDIFDSEYCVPSGLTRNQLLQAMQTPPLTTVLPYFLSSEPLLGAECIIRDNLTAENSGRFRSGMSGLHVTPVDEVAGTWTCSAVKDASHFANQLTGVDRTRNTKSVGLDMVIIDCAAAESCLRGAHIYAPGILACPGNMQKGDRVLVFCDVLGKCLKGRTTRFDEEIYYIGSGLAQISREDLFSRAAAPVGDGILIDRPRYPLLSLNEFLARNSEYSAQNLPSCFAVQVLGPKPGETILDCCAAPGGKTLHIASLMDNSGRLIAFEKSPERARKLKLAVKSFPVAEVYCVDAALKSSYAGLSSNLAGDSPCADVSFHRILVDAPCSGSGLRPRLSLRSLHIKQLRACPVNQKRILKSVVPFLKPGGTLVYSTCSVLVRENENVVIWLLKEFPKLMLVQQVPHIGDIGFDVPGLTTDQRACLQRFHMIPGKCSYDTIGFFIAKFCLT